MLSSAYGARPSRRSCNAPPLTRSITGSVCQQRGLAIMSPERACSFELKNLPVGRRLPSLLSRSNRPMQGGRPRFASSRSPHLAADCSGTQT